MESNQYVTIVLRKPVADSAQAQTILDIVKAKLEDQPDVTIVGKYNSTIDPTPPQE